VWRTNLAASAFDDKHVIPAWPETHFRPIGEIRPFTPVKQSPN
jgi:hypothetical protein